MADTQSIDLGLSDSDGGRTVNGLWPSTHHSTHINYLELLKALKHFLPHLQGYHVLVPCDNTTAVAKLQCSSLQAVNMEEAALSVITGDPSPGHSDLWCRPLVVGEPTLR